MRRRRRSAEEIWVAGQVLARADRGTQQPIGGSRVIGRREREAEKRIVSAVRPDKTRLLANDGRREPSTGGVEENRCAAGGGISLKLGGCGTALRGLEVKCRSHRGRPRG